MGLLYRGLQTKPAGGLLVQEKVTSMSSLIRSDWVTCHICIFLKIQLLHSFNNVVRVTFSFPNYEANSTNNILSNPSDYITSTLQADPIKNLHAEIICRKEQRISQRPRSCGIRRETTRIISKEWMQCLLEPLCEPPAYQWTHCDYSAWLSGFYLCKQFAFMNL